MRSGYETLNALKMSPVECRVVLLQLPCHATSIISETANDETDNTKNNSNNNNNNTNNNNDKNNNNHNNYRWKNGGKGLIGQLVGQSVSWGSWGGSQSWDGSLRAGVLGWESLES